MRISRIAPSVVLVLLFVAATPSGSVQRGLFLGFPAAFAATRSGDAFDYGAYATVLNAYVDTDGLVDYRGLKAHRQGLDVFVASLASLEEGRYSGWSEASKMAFWLNAYNALTLRAIIDHYPIEAGHIRGLVYPKNSIRQIPGVWTEIQWRVMGRPMTLDAIEHRVLRVEFKEPRIHAALVCAARGCPPLRAEPYTGEALNAQLDDQMRRFLADPGKFKTDKEHEVVYLSSLFKWYGIDFFDRHESEPVTGHGNVEDAVLNAVWAFVDNDSQEFLQFGHYSVTYLPYDWSLNEQVGREG